MKISIRRRLAVGILGGTLLIVAVIMGITYYYGRIETLREVESGAKNLARSYAELFEVTFQKTAKVPTMLGVYLETHPNITDDDLRSLMQETLRRNPEVYGSAVAFEPNSFIPERYYHSPYYYQNGEELTFVQLGNEEYDYFKWDWYRLPKEADEPYWTEPYRDIGGGEVIMTTYSVPFHKNGRFWGIATIDISLGDLMEKVRRLQVGQTGYAFILSREGKFVTFPKPEKVMQSGLEEYDKRIAARMTSGQEGIEPFSDPVTGQEAWILFTPIRSSGWSFAVVYPVKEILSSVIALQRRMFGIGALGLLVIFGIITVLARTITRPLEAFVGTARRIADGDLDQPLPATLFEDEIHDLSMAFGKMMEDLKQYMNDLARTVSEKERIESELKIARDIQRSILPRTFPPFPEQNEFDVYAINISAKEVGGDFYDFFYVDDQTLGFVIADVSGKGVPAALYMAVSRTLLKATALRGFPPGECLEKVNHLLIADNESTMFVTLFYGTINVHTGDLQYANGGHNLPYIKRKNGDLECLSDAHGLILGIMDDATYGTSSLKLNKGDAVFLYTDGVNEAEDGSGSFFGINRLETCLKKMDFCSVEEAVAKVKAEVTRFTGDAVQSDDITMMALQYMGSDGEESPPPQTM